MTLSVRVITMSIHTEVLPASKSRAKRKIKGQTDEQAAGEAPSWEYLVNTLMYPSEMQCG